MNQYMNIDKNLRAKLKAPSRQLTHAQLQQHLLSFWHHFAFHRRKCDLTGEDIISVFDENCPYPIWKQHEWYAHANPPNAQFDFEKPFFEQLWDLFKNCPIPHKLEMHNDNCEYTDDWWESKNCFLGHSGYRNEDCSYCYRSAWLKDCQFCCFAHKSECSLDLTNCFSCFQVAFALNCRNCMIAHLYLTVEIVRIAFFVGIFVTNAFVLATHNLLKKSLKNIKNS
jgi:hypothetical protein